MHDYEQQIKTFKNENNVLILEKESLKQLLNETNNKMQKTNVENEEIKQKLSEYEKSLKDKDQRINDINKMKYELEQMNQSMRIKYEQMEQ